jgi:hypothetical protein
MNTYTDLAIRSGPSIINKPIDQIPPSIAFGYGSGQSIHHSIDGQSIHHSID